MKAWPVSPSLLWAGRWEALEGGLACKGALSCLYFAVAMVDLIWHERSREIFHRP